jgi:hypothetical protein
VGPASVRPLKLLNYFFAFLVAYAIPFAGRLVSSTIDTEEFRDWRTWAWMCIPGGLSFLVLWPFLRRSVLRWIVSVFLCLAWAYLLSLATARVK